MDQVFNLIFTAGRAGLWFGVAAVAGVVLFLRGFKDLKRRRLLQNTPQSSVRSAALGLAEFSGLADGPYTITAPITQQKCFYYRTLLWRWQKDENKSNGHWHQIADEKLHIPFFLQDKTGRILIDPTGAEIELHKDFSDEYQASFFGLQMEPQQVQTFLAMHGLTPSDRVKLEEYCLKPRHALFILGTVAENPGIKLTPNPIREGYLSSARSLDTRSRFSALATLSVSTARISEGSGPVIVERTKIQDVPINLHTPLMDVHGMTLTFSPASTAERQASAPVKTPSALTKTPSMAGPFAPRPPNAIPAPGAATPPAAASVTPANAANAAVRGTTSATAVVDAPVSDAQKDAPQEDYGTGQLVVMKGIRRPEFFISWRSRRDVVGELAMRSVLSIWGGPLLTLASVVAILVRLHVL